MKMKCCSEVVRSRRRSGDTLQHLAEPLAPSKGSQQTVVGSLGLVLVHRLSMDLWARKTETAEGGRSKEARVSNCLLATVRCGEGLGQATLSPKAVLLPPLEVVVVQILRAKRWDMGFSVVVAQMMSDELVVLAPTCNSFASGPEVMVGELAGSC